LKDFSDDCVDFVSPYNKISINFLWRIWNF